MDAHYATDRRVSPNDWPIGVGSGGEWAHGTVMPNQQSDRSRVSAQAWARFRLLMKVMAVLTVVLVAAACWFFYSQGEPLSLHFYIALALGITGAMFMTGALMGLVFLSSGSGHDESVVDTQQDDFR